MEVKRYRLRRQPSPSPALATGILEDLDEEQRAVVTAPPGVLLVTAGAGTGKTRALTHRAAALIGLGGAPGRILLATFTNRAARQMRKRLEALVGGETRGLWCGTFHHLGTRVLRRHGEVLGVSPRFTILDRSDASDLLGQVIAARPSAGRRRRFPQPGLLASMISLSAGSLRPLEDVVAERYPRFAHQTKAICEAAESYAARKRTLGLLDFDDLLTGWLALLREHPAVALELGERFEHVLVDEYQDVNRLQAEIAESMAAVHESLTVVGDDDQSIYAFRGAWPDAMLRFQERYPAARIYRLQTNYRSTPEILSLANDSIARNVRRHDKRLAPSRPSGPRPIAVSVQDVEQQAAFVAQRILEIQEEEGLALRDMAVLFRNHAHSLELQVELTHRQIPFSLRSGLRFFEQAHVKDVLAHLRWQVNPADELAASRVLRLQPGIGPAMTERVIQFLASGDSAPLSEGLRSSLSASSVTGRGRGRVKALVPLMEALEKAANPGQAIRQVANGPYAEIARSRYANAAERLEDLSQLADYAERYEETQELLAEIALMQGLAAEAFGEGEAPDDRLTLSTVHQAKGLEWKAVFLIWLCDGHFPSAFALKDPTGEEEERRLFHVAVTRAQDLLTLVHPILASQGAMDQVITRPSRLITELPDPDVLERWRVVDEPDDPKDVPF